jgi:tripartite ATP-independent transporter DctP family solute receptor
MTMSRLAIAALAIAVGAISQPAEAQQRTLKFGHVYEAVHPMHAASLAAAEHMNRCTSGAVKVDVFPASQLGSEKALNEQIRFGGVDVILTGQLFSAGDYKPIAVGAAPYIFRDRDHALKYRTSDVLKELMAGYNKATGQHMVSAGYFGAFNVSSNKPITRPEDMRGLKIRVPDVPLYMAFPRAVGANPTPVAFAEVYLALQQGVVEASVNPLPVTFAFKFYEVQKFVALTGHLVEYGMLIYGDHVMRALDDGQRRCAQEAADHYAAQSTEAIVRQENNLRAEMTEKKLIQFTDPDRAAFQAATAGVIDDLIRQGQFSRDVVERIRAIR